MHTPRPVAATAASFLTDDDFNILLTPDVVVHSTYSSPAFVVPPECPHLVHEATSRTTTSRDFFNTRAASGRSFAHLRSAQRQNFAPAPSPEFNSYSFDYIPDLPPGTIFPAIGLTMDGRTVDPANPHAIFSFWKPDNPALLPAWRTLIAAHSELFQGSTLYRQTLHSALAMATGPIRVHMTTQNHDWPASITENTNQEKVITINPDLINSENKTHEIKKAFVFELHNAALSAPFRDIHTSIHAGLYEQINSYTLHARDSAPESRMAHLLMRHAYDQPAVASALAIENVEINSQENTTKTFQDLAGFPFFSMSPKETIDFLRHQTLCGHTQKYVLNYNTPLSLPSEFFVNPKTKSLSEYMYSLPLATPDQMKSAEYKIYEIYNQKEYGRDLYRSTLQTHIRLLILQNSDHYECYMRDDLFNTPEPEAVEQAVLDHAISATMLHFDAQRLLSLEKAIQSLFPNVQILNILSFMDDREAQETYTT